MHAMLLAARKRRGWTQARAAEEAGISRQHYSQIEEGAKQPSSRVARKISSALGITLDDLLSDGTPAASGQ